MAYYGGGGGIMSEKNSMTFELHISFVKHFIPGVYCVILMLCYCIYYSLPCANLSNGTINMSLTYTLTNFSTAAKI